MMNTPSCDPHDPRRLADEAGMELFDLGLGADDDCPERPGGIIGRYRLIAPLGEGGFGFVWHAEQTEPIRRELAMKLIKRGMDSREIIERFAAESRSLAMMDHPNIAAVLDAGTMPDGRPYFAMELVRGEPLTCYCDSRNLSIRERLELFIPVCQAVQHAHQKAILHRDLKPSNILVSVIDGRPVPKVIDFGIAKALGTEEDLARQSTLPRTRVGAVMGTPEYMSPEQAGSVPDVDTRSDIYSLGVILYELLTGLTPLARCEGEASHDETLRRIRTEEALKPSTSFHPPTAASLRAAATRDAEPSKLRRMLKGDLDWVVLKALEKDRRRRYGTATALAADLNRFLKAEPVSAVAPTWHYQFSRLVRRNRTAFVAAAVVFLTLSASTGVSLWQASEARKAGARAEQSRIDAERSRADAESNAAKARKTVETYLTKVSDHPKLKEEAFQGLRKELLETALPFYEEMAAKESGEPNLRSDRAWVLAKLSGIYRSLGQREKSVESLREAMRIEEALSEEFPEDQFYKRSIVISGNNIAVILGEMGMHPESIEINKHSIEVVEGLVRQHPDNDQYATDLSILLVSLAQNFVKAGKFADAEATMLCAIEVRQMLSNKSPDSETYQDDVASSYTELARVLGENGKIPEAEARFRKALAIREKLLESSPMDGQFRRNLADTCHNFAYYLHRSGKSEEALALQRRSMEMNRKLSVDFPVDSTFRYALALGNQSAGTSLVALRRPAEAVEAFRNSVEIQRALATEFPDNAGYFYLAALSSDSIAKVRREENDPQAAKECFRDSVEMQRKALNVEPTNAAYRSALGGSLRGFAEMCLLTHDATGAMTAAAEIPRYFPNSWEDLERAAGFMAGAVPLLDNDATMDPISKRQAVDRATQSAISFLKNSIELGNLQQPDVLEHAPFSVLRGSPGFDELEKLFAPDPTDRSPSSFSFNYPFSDPGPRMWKREGQIWIEKSPSGVEKKFNIVRRIRQGEVSGTELGDAGGSGLSIFVPDMGTLLPAVVKMKQRTGSWANLGMIEKME
jgi:serine/threonine protein kinase